MKSAILYRFILLTACTMSTVSAQDNLQPSPAIEAQVIAMQLDGTAMLLNHRLLSERILVPFYTQRNFAPAWNEAKIEQAMHMFASAESHGLLREDFLYFTLQGITTSETTEDLAARDVLLTEALIRYIYQREFGKLNPVELDNDINFEREVSADLTPSAVVADILSSEDLEQRINDETTHGAWYELLRQELARLYAIDDQGGWPLVTEGPTLHAGDDSPRISQIRERLAHHGEGAGEPTGASTVYDAELENRVRTFQKDHGRDDDGVIGPATLRAMNAPVTERIDQVRLSLERIRWTNQDRESTDSFVAVNIAGFRVYVVEDGQLTWTTRAMVGKPYRQTPVFKGRMQYLEFNPTWTVPPGIHRRDTLPAVKKDVNYLAEKHFIVLTPQGEEVDPHSIDWNSFGSTAPYIFRQVPGPWNALGQVKFIFPNSHFVFLHDTNHREMFSEPHRAFSSGCIRVQDPMDLAELLLNDKPDWSRTEIDELLASGETKRINLTEPLPVYILYLTAAVDTDGSVLYLDDVYERDSRVLNALDQPMHFELPGTGP